MKTSESSGQSPKDSPVRELDSVPSDGTAPSLHARRIGGVIMIVNAVFVVLTAVGVWMISRNWDAMGRTNRTVFSLLPLITAIALTTFVFVRRRESVAWRESAGLFYFLSLGASISLMTQTYHLYNNTEEILFLCMALTLPLIYLLGSGMAFFGFLVCLIQCNIILNRTTYYGGVLHYRIWSVDYTPLLWWLGALPFCVWQAVRQRRSMPVWTRWIFFAFVFAGACLYRPHASGWYFLIGLPVLFTLCYFVRRYCLGNSDEEGTSSRFALCVTMAVCPAVVNSFESNRTWLSKIVEQNIGPEWGSVCFLSVFAATWVAILVSAGYHKKVLSRVTAFFPVLIAAAWDSPFLMVVHIFFFGIFTLIEGAVRKNRFEVNDGAMLLIIFSPVLLVFFNDFGSDRSMISIIVIFSAFLIGMNFWLSRKHENTLAENPRSSSTPEQKDKLHSNLFRRIHFACFSILSLVAIAAVINIFLRYENVRRNGVVYKFRIEPISSRYVFGKTYVTLKFKDDNCILTSDESLSYNHYNRIWYVRLKDKGFAVPCESSLNPFVKSKKSFRTLYSDLPPGATAMNPSGDNNGVIIVDKAYRAVQGGQFFEYQFNRYYMPEKITLEAELAYREAVRKAPSDKDNYYVTVRVLDNVAVVDELYLNGIPLRATVTAFKPQSEYPTKIQKEE